MDLEKILQEKIYRDKAKIYRGENGEGWGGVNWRLIYEDVPCHLSQHSRSSIRGEKQARAAEVEYEFRLSTSPAVVIMENDALEVEHGGQIYELTAVSSFGYSSHNEAACRRRKEATQWK